MDWIALYPAEKQIYIEKAKNLIESGMYVGFSVEELAILLQKSEIAASQ